MRTRRAIPAAVALRYLAPMPRRPCVYILASQRNGTLYVGVTSDLAQRIWQHKQGEAEGFTRRYHVKSLVWYEPHPTMESAITREKQIKEWQRAYAPASSPPPRPLK
jgi:putative endonuclease